MAKEKRHSRYPAANDEIHVNHCKNPLCENFGVLPSESREGEVSRKVVGGYVIIGSEHQGRSLFCKLCSKYSAVRKIIEAVLLQGWRIALRQRHLCA